jgi:hypothetical protein
VAAARSRRLTKTVRSEEVSGLAPNGTGDAGAGPLDFRDEIASELRTTYHELAGDRERIAALEELERLTIDLAARLRRPLTVFDLVQSAPDGRERERRIGLVRELRRPEG